MTQIQPVAQPHQYSAPSINAVKIDVHEASVNAPSFPVTHPRQQKPEKQAVTAPIYDVPKASVYEVPKATTYGPKENLNQPVAPKELPAPQVPQPVVPQPVVEKKPEEKTEVKPEVKPEGKLEARPEVKQEAKPEAKAEMKPEIQAPKEQTPQVDVNSYISKMKSENFDEQARTMESIADLAQNQPKKAADLLDVKVIESLLDVMSKDSSKLAGPTPRQLELRGKINNKQTVTDAENAEANTITPMELAERNKQYAMYTTAILQKLYTDEVQKLSGQVVPLTELPGAAGIVEQVKSNPNPMVRAAGLDSLSYVQRPEYAADLKTIFTIAMNDKDSNVKEAAKKGLEKLTHLQQPAPAPKADNATAKAAV